MIGRGLVYVGCRSLRYGDSMSEIVGLWFPVGGVVAFVLPGLALCRKDGPMWGFQAIPVLLIGGYLLLLLFTPR